ncbi:4029_t:CDS:2, partial [Funneliformis caledonium]
VRHIKAIKSTSFSETNFLLIKEYTNRSRSKDAEDFNTANSKSEEETEETGYYHEERTKVIKANKKDQKQKNDDIHETFDDNVKV